MTTKIFLSFVHTSKRRAMWLRERLLIVGHEVTLEDDFGVGSPRKEMLQAIQDSEVVVSIVSPEYPNSAGAQRELDLAEAHGKDVVAIFAGLESRSLQARPYAAYRRVELEEIWNDTDDQWERIVGLVTRVLDAKNQQNKGATEPAPPVPRDARAAVRVEEAILFYDIEDRLLAHQLLAVLPNWRPANDPPDGRLNLENGLPRVLLWTTASAEPHSLVRSAFAAISSDVPRFLVLAGEATEPLAGLSTVPVDELMKGGPREAHDRSTGRQRLGASLEQLVDMVEEANQGVPIDVFSERFCCSRKVAAAAERAYRFGVGKSRAGTLLRLRAVYDYALVLRFYGEWRQAVEVIQDELMATPHRLSADAEGLRLRLQLEKLSVEYELGDHRADGLDQRIREIQLQFRRLGDIQGYSGYVQAGRVHAIVLVEQGDFDTAERVIQRTIGVAEYLAESPIAENPGHLLLADCHRELAGIYIARRDIRRARGSLEDSRKVLEGGREEFNSAIHYLGAVLDYVDATLAQSDDVLVKATSPTEQARAALEMLSRFDNPIRAALVYDWLGRAWARQVPRRRDDLIRGEEYLRKALRVRKTHGHSYTCGLSYLSLGELYEVLGDMDRAIASYEEGRLIFNQRGQRPALARTHAALARVHLRRSLIAGGEAKTVYRDHLDQADQLYQEIQLGNEGLELRYELEHRGRRPMDDVPDDTPLVAVGEYLLHRWIREYTASRNTSIDRQFELLVGIGDDAAVLSSRGIEPSHSLVYTTDSAPGSLAALSKSPAYVGRFAVVQTVADVISMGARPVAILVNIFLSRSATVGYARRLISAVVEEANRYGIIVLGGDIKERYEQSVGCVGIGCVRNDQILTRNAARSGQVVGITLASNSSGSGYRRIGARWAQELVEHYRMNRPGVIADFPELAQIVDPQLKYDLLYVPDKVMASAVRTGCLRGAMDTSDGVQACLEILGRESDVGFELDESAIDSIIDDRARRLADILGLPAALFLFSAGHDWEIVFTCEEKDFALVEAAVANDLRGHGRVARLGTVVERSESDERGVLLRRVDGSRTAVQYYTDEKFVPRNYQDRPSQWLGFASRVGG